MKALVIILILASSSVAVIANAYYQKKQFYPMVIYITKSSPSMTLIYVQIFGLFVLLSKLVRVIFFGQLRPAEIEHQIERSWYAITETFLAFTLFRDDISLKFVALFMILLFLKSFHWLAEDRVDFMERSPNISVLFHIRIVSILVFLAAINLYSIKAAYQSTLSRGTSVQLVFGSEYAILMTMVLNVFIKYALHLVDLRREDPWENKPLYILYVDLLINFVKASLYLSFISMMMKFQSIFPLYAIRPMYLSIRTFHRAFKDVIMSRRAIQNMNTLYPSATIDDLTRNDNVCIICREEMSPNGGAKKLPCNHIFHVSCLHLWFQRQQTCPTCRMDVLRYAGFDQPQTHSQAAAQPPPARPPPPVATSAARFTQPVPGQQATVADLIIGNDQVNAFLQSLTRLLHNGGIRIETVHERNRRGQVEGAEIQIITANTVTSEGNNTTVWPSGEQSSESNPSKRDAPLNGQRILVKLIFSSMDSESSDPRAQQEPNDNSDERRIIEERLKMINNIKTMIDNVDCEISKFIRLTPVDGQGLNTEVTNEIDSQPGGSNGNLSEVEKLRQRRLNRLDQHNLTSKYDDSSHG